MNPRSVLRRRPRGSAVSPAPQRVPVPPGKDESLALASGALTGLLGYHLAQAAVATNAAFVRHVEVPLGLRKVEYSMLILLQANGPLSPKRLANALALSAPNLTMLLDRMQERGVIRRERNPDDGRSQHVVLTAEGGRLARSCAMVAEPMERDVRERLTGAEHAMLIELLGKVAARPTPR